MRTFVLWSFLNGAAALLTVFFCCMESNIRKCGKVLAWVVAAIVAALFWRENPEIIGASRKKRIAAGAGVRIEEVNKLLKAFEQMRKMIRQFSSPGMARKMKRMKGFGGGFPGFPGM